MDFIDSSFALMRDWAKIQMPEGILTDLIAEGIISGIGGIVIFIPQIAFLFLFISVLEETGYINMKLLLWVYLFVKLILNNFLDNLINEDYFLMVCF